MSYHEGNAELISVKEKYPRGANHPTTHMKYVCPCGKGTVEFVRVAGFDDSYLEIHCRKCRKRYEVTYGCGHWWELEAIDEDEDEDEEEDG